MMITNRSSLQMCLRYLIMEKGTFLLFPYPQESITKWTIRRERIFHDIRIFRYRLPIWPLLRIMILWAAMRTIVKEAFCMLPIIMWHRERNSGHGAMETSVMHGTV